MIMGKINKEYIFLFFILCIAAVLRFWQLGAVPSGFDADEAAFGYNTYSIIKTGKDEYGTVLPIILKSFGEYKPALYAYLSIPSVIIFGLTPFAVRFVSAFFGVLTVLVLYFLTLKLFDKKRIALITSLLFALLPWHIILSRTTSEVVVSLFFILIMLDGITTMHESFSRKWFFVSLFSGLLAIISYTASTFFVVIITFLSFVFAIKRQKTGIRFNKYVLILLVLLLILGYFYTSLGSINRFKQVNIFQHPETKLIMEEQIREDKGTPLFLTRLHHNKIVNNARTIFENYSSYFTVDYLFINGGYPHRQRIPANGLFYIWQLPFLILGLIFIIKQNSKRGLFIISLWIFLLFPTAITFDETPNVYRSLVISPFIMMIIGLGIASVLTINRKVLKLVIIFTSAIAVFELSYFLHQYYIHQERHQPWYRGFAYKELIANLEELSPDYKKIIFTKALSSPYIYTLFYSRYDPQTYQDEGSLKDIDHKGFGKYQFTPDECPLRGGETLDDTVTGEEGLLYIIKGTCMIPTHSIKHVKTINWNDGNPAFILLEYVKPADTL